MKSHRGRISLTLLLQLGAVMATAGEFDLLGNFQVRGVAVDAPSPWLEGGFGRFTEGRGTSTDWGLVPRATGQVGFDWSPIATLRFHGHGLARWESDESRGDAWGLVEAYARWSPEPSPSLRLRLQAGLFLP
jgi:hypothetical protein